MLQTKSFVLSEKDCKCLKLLLVEERRKATQFTRKPSSSQIKLYMWLLLGSTLKCHRAVWDDVSVVVYKFQLKLNVFPFDSKCWLLFFLFYGIDLFPLSLYFIYSKLQKVWVLKWNSCLLNFCLFFFWYSTCVSSPFTANDLDVIYVSP